MKKLLKIKQTSLYQIFERLKENKQANLFDIAMEQVDLYIDTYDHAEECDYIKGLKKHDMFISLAKHLGNENTRGRNFLFDEQLKVSNKNLDPIRKFIYKKWRMKNLSVFETRLKHPTTRIQYHYEELVSEFEIYDIKDKQKIKIKLGIKR